MGTATGTFSGRPNHRIRLETQLASQNIEGNYSTINWQLYLERTDQYGSWYLTAGGSRSVNIGGNVWNGGAFTYDTRSTATIALGSGAFNVGHNADGSGSYGFSSDVAAPGTLGSASCSGSEGLPTIPRATTPTVTPASGSTGSTFTINHVPASSAFYHDVAYSLNGGGSYTNIATNVVGTDHSTSWTPAHTLLPDDTSATAIIRLITRSSSGGTIIGTKTVSLPLTVPTSVKPTISSVSWSDAQTSAPDIPTMMGGAGRFVQRWSKLKPTVTSTGAGGSSIVSSTVTQNGQTTPSGTAFGLPINLSGAVPYSAIVKDSRGRDSDAYANTVAVTAYNFPNLPTPLVTRTSDAAGNVPSPTGTYLAITPGASVSSLIFGGAQKNLLEWQVRVMPVGGAWTTVQAWTSSGVSGNTWTTKFVAGGGYSASTEYIVEVSIRDVFGKNGYNTSQTVAVKMIGVPTESVFMDWDGANGLGIGKYRQNGMLDVAGQIYQNNGVRVGADTFLDTNYAIHKPSAPYSDFPLGISTTLVDPDPGWPKSNLYGALTTIRAYGSGGSQLQYWSSYQKDDSTIYYRQWFYLASDWGPWRAASSRTGEIIMWPTTVAPVGAVLCDGASYTTAAQPALFAVIGYTYGGSGSTFLVPNFKGRFPVMIDSAQAEFNVLNEKGGEKTHDLSVNEIPPHGHALSVPGTMGGTQKKMYSDWAGGGTMSAAGPNMMGNMSAWGGEVVATNTGGGAAHNNLPPYIGINFIINL